jgi:hypothetical protein
MPYLQDQNDCEISLSRTRVVERVIDNLVRCRDGTGTPLATRRQHRRQTGGCGMVQPSSSGRGRERTVAATSVACWTGALKTLQSVDDECASCAPSRGCSRSDWARGDFRCIMSVTCRAGVKRNVLVSHQNRCDTWLTLACEERLQDIPRKGEAKTQRPSLVPLGIVKCL